MSLRILLLQARLSDDPMAEQEHRCFVSRTGLPREAIACHDLCAGPPTIAELERHDALMVGGSGEFYISKENLPEFDAFMEFLREVVERGRPAFFSCFGYQSLVRALGGSLIHDPPSAEVGTYELTLTEPGKADPLFGYLPERFMAQMGHKDRASRVPDGTLNLASSERSPYQALCIPGKPIWATQFHPELDRSTNLERFNRYQDKYGPLSGEECDAVRARFGDSPEASTLLSRFLELVFG